MRAVELCQSNLYEAYFAHTTDAEIIMGPENGVTYGAYCESRVTINGSPNQVENVIDANGLAAVCENPAVAAFLGSCMIFAAQDIDHVFTNYADLRFCYPTVDKLLEQIEKVQRIAPDLQPPELRKFDGYMFSADQQMAALSDGVILISEIGGHDMMVHVPVWLTISRYSGLFEQLRRSATESLQNPGEPDEYDRLACNRLTDYIDATIAITPLLGDIMCNPLFQIPAKSQLKFLAGIMGGEQQARSALFEFGACAQNIGRAVMRAGL